MQFVLDASISLRWCFLLQQTPASVNALQLMESAEAPVPMLWPYEMVSVLQREVNKGTLTHEALTDFLDMLGTFKIIVGTTPVVLSRLYQQAKTHRLTGYDAAYLELALERRLPLATADDAMIAAAQRAGVPLLA